MTANRTPKTGEHTEDHSTPHRQSVATTTWPTTMSLTGAPTMNPTTDAPTTGQKQLGQGQLGPQTTQETARGDPVIRSAALRTTLPNVTG